MRRLLILVAAALLAAACSPSIVGVTEQPPSGSTVPTLTDAYDQAQADGHGHAHPEGYAHEWADITPQAIQALDDRFAAASDSFGAVIDRLAADHATHAIRADDYDYAAELQQQKIMQTWNATVEVMSHMEHDIAAMNEKIAGNIR